MIDELKYPGTKVPKKPYDLQTVSVTVRLTRRQLRILEAIQKARGDETRSDTIKHAIKVLMAGFKITEGKSPTEE